MAFHIREIVDSQHVTTMNAASDDNYQMTTQTGKSISLMQSSFYRKIVDPFGMKAPERVPKISYLEKLLFRSARTSPKMEASQSIKQLSSSQSRANPMLQAFKATRSQS